MKIALIHYRLLYKGGLETRLRNYIRWFSEQGHEVTVIVARKKKEVPVPKGVRIVVLSPGLMLKGFRKAYFSYRVNKYLNRNKFDFSLSLGRTTGQDAVLAAANHQGYLKAMNLPGRRMTDYWQNKLDDQSFRNSKKIFAASEMMREELIKYYGVAPEKISILHPPLNTKKFSTIPDFNQREAKVKLGFDPEKTTFLFVSIGHKRKGIDVLSKVFRQLPENKYELIIAGLPKIDLGMPHVKYVGFRKDTPELYRAADYTIHPALYEPFGQVVSESLACGTPVLVSHMVGAKEIVDQHEGVVIHSFSTEDWLNAIKGLKSRDFHISDEVIKQKGLSLEQHMKRMLKEF